MWYLALLKRCRSLYIRNLLGSYPPSWLQTGPNHEYSGSNAAMCPSINVPAFAASWPHRHCTSPCPEYRCRSADAHSWLLQLGQCLCLVTCLSPRWSSPPHNLNVSYWLCNVRLELEAREPESLLPPSGRSSWTIP